MLPPHGRIEGAEWLSPTYAGTRQQQRRSAASPAVLRVAYGVDSGPPRRQRSPGRARGRVGSPAALLRQLAAIADTQRAAAAGRSTSPPRGASAAEPAARARLPPIEDRPKLVGTLLDLGHATPAELSSDSASRADALWSPPGGYLAARAGASRTPPPAAQAARPVRRVYLDAAQLLPSGSLGELATPQQMRPLRDTDVRVHGSLEVRAAAARCFAVASPRPGLCERRRASLPRARSAIWRASRCLAFARFLKRGPGLSSLPWPRLAAPSALERQAARRSRPRPAPS
jgi:hypothetical protein